MVLRDARGLRSGSPDPQVIPNQAASGKDLEASVRAQAKLRAMVGLPIILAGTISLWSTENRAAVALLATLHVLYIVLMLLCTRHPHPKRAGHLAYATAVLDPLMLSASLPLLGEYGGLVVGFYLFTILGFGFRIGPRLMLTSQIAAIAGFSVVQIFPGFWQQHPVIWLSFLVTLIVVPFYATVLIRKLHEARAHAERESLAKSQLLARVSHELRTPLSGIVMAGQLLLAESKDKQAVVRAETILGLSKDLLREITDLLDQSKYEAKALVLHAVPLELHQEMARVRVTVEAAAAKKGLALSVTVDPGVRDSVLGDPHYLTRVLINLAGNAVKFTDRGEIAISVQLLDEDASQYRVRFAVRDTGIGIPRDFHERIFEPFFQVDGGTTRRHGGTGLGMTIAREIVKLMGGDLRVESELGKGSLFYFDLALPRVLAPGQTAAQADAKAVSGRKIFVAEDNETNLMLLKELLEQDRHEVVVARSGTEALDILAAREFDVLFLDFNMNDMDGAKLLQIYRFGRLRAAPAYFLTADATEVTAAKLRDAGAIDVLHKPITIQELREAIARVCGQPQAAPTVRAAVPATARTGPVPAATEPTRPVLTVVPPQPIDLAVIENLKLISSRPAFLRELLLRAREDIRSNCDDLVQALVAQDFDRLHHDAHALKGVCASIGAARLVALCSLIMRSPRNDLELGRDRLQDDIMEAARVSSAAIDHIVAGMDRPDSAGHSAALLHTN